MLHSGGTKFYQIFEFRPQSGLPVTLVHFGPRTALVDTFHRPINGGQTKLHRGALADSKRREKEARGYSEQDSVTTFINRMNSTLRETFGAQLAHELDVAMYGHLAGADDAPKVEPDNEFVPAETEPETRPEAWGTW